MRRRLVPSMPQRQRTEPPKIANQCICIDHLDDVGMSPLEGRSSQRMSKPTKNPASRFAAGLFAELLVAMRSPSPLRSVAVAASSDCILLTIQRPLLDDLVGGVRLRCRVELRPSGLPIQSGSVSDPHSGTIQRPLQAGSIGIGNASAHDRAATPQTFRVHISFLGTHAHLGKRANDAARRGTSGSTRQSRHEPTSSDDRTDPRESP